MCANEKNLVQKEKHTHTQKEAEAKITRIANARKRGEREFVGKSVGNPYKILDLSFLVDQD